MENPLQRFAPLALLVAAAPVRARMQTYFPSKFGPNDQIGNLNHITPEKTLAAAKLITRGKAYRLGIETNSRTPAFPPRTFALTVLQPVQVAGGTLGSSKTTYNDDIISGWGGIGSQLDGLATSVSTTSTTTATRPRTSSRPTGSPSSASRTCRRSPRAQCCSTWRATSTPTSSRKARRSTAPRSTAR